MHRVRDAARPTDNPETGVPVAEVVDYVRDVVRRTREPLACVERLPAHRDPCDGIFAELTSHEFGYLGRSRSQPYRENVLEHLRRDVEQGRPVRFFLDIGPGYHASLCPQHEPLSYDVGLAELLVLHQIASFCSRVAAIYEPGARFWLVIDNLCALATNDIPLERTEGYVSDFRRLIAAVGAGELVSLCVESELNGWETYDGRFGREPECPVPMVQDTDVENVARFLGRSCTPGEAAERIERYRRAGIVTEELLAPAIDGVRLTQRATATTLGFRAFPGGDQRIQVGEVCLVRHGNEKLWPRLITSRSVGRYLLFRVDVSELALAPVGSIRYAQRAAP